MTTPTPDNAGWVDPQGVPQRGAPPPGWWQASDLRWYPPSAASPAPVPAAAASPAAIGAQPAPVPKQSRSGCAIAAVVGLVVVLLGGCGVVVVAALGGASLFAVRSSSSSSDPLPAATAPLPVEQDGEIQSCTRIDDRTYQLDLVNRGSGTATYTVSVKLDSASGAAVASSSTVVYALRPGERSVETGPAQTVGAWATCRATVVTRTQVPVASPAALAEVSCQVLGTDAQGRVRATATATNTAGTTPLRYNLVAAFVDADGVRRGAALGRIPAVQPKGTGSDTLVNLTRSRPGLTCEVVDVLRLP